MSKKEKEFDNKLFAKELNEDELKVVSGGFCFMFGSSGKGNCTGSYYVESCTATVDKGSRCASDDWCHSDESSYNANGPVI